MRDNILEIARKAAGDMKEMRATRIEPLKCHKSAAALICLFSQGGQDNAIAKGQEGTLRDELLGYSFSKSIYLISSPLNYEYESHSWVAITYEGYVLHLESNVPSYGLYEWVIGTAEVPGKKGDLTNGRGAHWVSAPSYVNRFFNNEGDLDVLSGCEPHEPLVWARYNLKLQGLDIQETRRLYTVEGRASAFQEQINCDYGS